MVSFIYNTIIFNPLYNGLIYLIDTAPWIDVGVAVIVFTIIVRLILFPLSKKSIVAQARMKEIEPELATLRNTVKDRQVLALKTMELYKQKNISPFSSILFLLVQLPIIFALYSIFTRSGLPIVKTDLLYSFIQVPSIKMVFLGIVDMKSKSIILALIAGIAQFIQLHFSLASQSSNSSANNSQPAMMQSMTKNMKIFFPIMIFAISYKLPVVALYMTVSSLFTLGQELVVRRHLKRHQPL